MSSEIRTIGTKRLFVEDTEDESKPAIVFIHGLGGATTFYDSLVPALAEKYRLVRLDFDGHGRSPRTGPITVPAIADDVAALITTLPGKHAHIVAHSMGTLVAQELAARYSDYVDSLVLLGPVRAQPEAGKAATRARATTVREKGMSAVAETIAANATSAAGRAENPLIFALVRELLLGQDPEGYAAACEALAAAESPDLSRISAPTLVLAGEEDKVMTDAILEELRGGLKKLDIARTRNCGHWTAVEAPAFVAGKTLEFIGSLS